MAVEPLSKYPVMHLILKLAVDRLTIDLSSSRYLYLLQYLSVSILSYVQIFHQYCESIRGNNKTRWKVNILPTQIGYSTSIPNPDHYPRMLRMQL